MRLGSGTLLRDGLQYCEGEEECKINLPLEIVRAGDHCSLKISRQMDPLALILKARDLVS